MLLLFLTGKWVVAARLELHGTIAALLVVGLWIIYCLGVPIWNTSKDTNLVFLFWPIYGNALVAILAFCGVLLGVAKKFRK